MTSEVKQLKMRLHATLETKRGLCFSETSSWFDARFPKTRRNALGIIAANYISDHGGAFQQRYKGQRGPAVSGKMLLIGFVYEATPMEATVRRATELGFTVHMQPCTYKGHAAKLYVAAEPLVDMSAAIAFALQLLEKRNTE